MKLPRTIAETIERLATSRNLTTERLNLPTYCPMDRPSPSKIMLAVASLKNHMTSEGWQLQLSLQHADYVLCGPGLGVSCADCSYLLDKFQPSTVVVQDKREWDQLTQSSRGDGQARFINLELLRSNNSIFKATVLKDSHKNQNYHAQSAEEIGAHAWIVYYHPHLVSYLAPYVRPKHLIRTWHSIDANEVPSYSPSDRKGCVLSGAVSGAYPLRRRLLQDFRRLPDCTLLRHPGYHANGSATPAYLKTLSRFKVAICTSSVYGYALRKIVEATACGCRVLTDLPVDDVLPEIDDNLIRIHPDEPTSSIASLLQGLIETYDSERQQHLADKVKQFHDYRALGLRLAADIETLQQNYNEATLASSAIVS